MKYNYKTLFSNLIEAEYSDIGKIIFKPKQSLLIYLLIASCEEGIPFETICKK